MTSRVRSQPPRCTRFAVLAGLAGLALGAGLCAEDPTGAPELLVAPLFNWDIVSLEQNLPRFNGSVLTGFHSLRSPGVTPRGATKLGVGLLYSREEQFARTATDSFFRRNQVFLNPKSAFGIWNDVEVGAGLSGSWVEGRELVGTGATERTRAVADWLLDSGDLGVKWKFFDRERYRLAASFDTRLALSRADFGSLPGNFFNFEIDGDYAATRRLSLAANLQLLASDSNSRRDQVIVDFGAIYSFTDVFRGMLLGTLQEDDEADTVLGFIGLAGQLVEEQHAFTLSFDLQLNDAKRAVRTEEQLDISLSYTFTF